MSVTFPLIFKKAAGHGEPASLFATAMHHLVYDV